MSKRLTKTLSDSEFREKARKLGIDLNSLDSSELRQYKTEVEDRVEQEERSRLRSELAPKASKYSELKESLERMKSDLQRYERMKNKDGCFDVRTCGLEVPSDTLCPSCSPLRRHGLDGTYNQVSKSVKQYEKELSDLRKFAQQYNDL